MGRIEYKFDNVIMLPCNIGDTLYQVYFWDKKHNEPHIVKRYVAGININDGVRYRHLPSHCTVTLRSDCGDRLSGYLPLTSFGTTLFKTPQDAKVVYPLLDIHEYV